MVDCLMYFDTLKMLTKKPTENIETKLNDENNQKKGSVHVHDVSINTDADGDGGNIQFGSGFQDCFGVETNTNANANVFGSEIAKDAKSMKNIQNYLLDQSLKQRKENDGQFKGGKFGKKESLKRKRLEKLSKLRKQQISKMRLLNRVAKNNGRGYDDNGNNENGNGNEGENPNEDKENEDIDMQPDSVVNQFLHEESSDDEDEDDNRNQNENKNENENKNNIGEESGNINVDINVNINNNGQNGDKKDDSDSYFCQNCVMYFDDKAARDAIYHPKSNK